MNNYEAFSLILDCVIELNKKLRSDRDGLRENLGLHTYMSEHCTIRFNVGRQVGKTEYIKRNCGPEDLIIILKNAYKRMFLECPVDRRDIVSIRQYLNNITYYKIKPYKNIWIDEFTFVNDVINGDLRLLYDVLGRNEVEQTFVFLG